VTFHPQTIGWRLSTDRQRLISSLDLVSGCVCSGPAQPYYVARAAGNVTGKVTNIFRNCMPAVSMVGYCHTRRAVGGPPREGHEERRRSPGWM